ncbi:UNKNOWN [Stylonychia lemnae]|uniref:Thioredoxin domain-containing protein n=1 Tax=Stylonychia lemnae TaxID=5949 RepID=A0A078B7I7_STYLE|nr:UNKNOWN [Stylonychia lemnae]|eukprot:CDW89262.1 UNKNOWN [Stylonychia lemnae]
MRGFEDLFFTKKHIILQFYDPKCAFCYEFLEDYNQLYYYFMQHYGEEQIQLFMIDGTQEGFDWVISKFKIEHCPYVVYIPPKTDGSEDMKIGGRFQGEVMAYHDVKEWILATVKDLKVKEETDEQDSYVDENDIEIISPESIEKKKFRDTAYDHEMVIEQQKIKAEEERYLKEHRIRQEQEKKEHELRHQQHLEQQRKEREEQDRFQKEQIEQQNSQHQHQQSNHQHVNDPSHQHIHQQNHQQHKNHNNSQNIVHNNSAGNTQKTIVDQSGNQQQPVQDTVKPENIIYGFTEGPKDNSVTKDRQEKFNYLIAQMLEINKIFHSRIDEVRKQGLSLLKEINDPNQESEKSTNKQHRGLKFDYFYLLIGYLFGLIMTSIGLQIVIKNIKQQFTKKKKARIQSEILFIHDKQVYDDDIETIDDNECSVVESLKQSNQRKLLGQVQEKSA